MNGQQVRYSIVVPVFNEEKNVSPLHREIVAVMNKLGAPYEIIFVDDGSTDKTFSKLQKLLPLTIIKLETNSGQSSALASGIRASRGEIIITLDGDRQNDPRDIPRLISHMEKKNLDMVCGWRKSRQDSLSKRIVSMGAALLRTVLADDDVHDSGCTLRVYKRKVFENLDLYGEMHRFIPALVKWRGYKIGEIAVKHRPRTRGQTKYTSSRILRGLLDMLYIWFWRKYAHRPLHLFGGLGLLCIVSGSVLLAVLAYLRLFEGYRLSDKIWPLVGFFSILIGLQLLVSGLISAHMVALHRESKETEEVSVTNTYINQ